MFRDFYRMADELHRAVAPLRPMVARWRRAKENVAIRKILVSVKGIDNATAKLEDMRLSIDELAKSFQAFGDAYENRQ